MSLDAALDGLERRLQRASKGRFLQVRVARVWDEVAGPTVARHTAGVYLRSGELNVLVDSHVWAAELSALSGPYIEAFNAVFGRSLVRSVRFTVSRRVRQAKEEEEAREAVDPLYSPEPGRAVPLSPTERAQVEASVAVIDDVELREAALRATIASMEWQKGRKGATSRQKPREEP